MNTTKEIARLESLARMFDRLAMNGEPSRADEMSDSARRCREQAASLRAEQAAAIARVNGRAS